ncbi:uridine kinase [Oleiphilus sp. HI0071]|uniref:uridine kinase n=1 Tax=Oleiphilus sp. HI0080 TaxID=1822255 RepID=UPI0007C30ECD|nr:uridine kinase [Oleiphilus sp. HI0080]KZY67192.1 uridine kinase [Oleiphilus sp. HI0065]KZY79800.1 uridine kinase [Oleiphilus sp. HI0071]KZY91933.1 uridine kinase [Oleiphilus sp. HI0073]KZZ57880.1 uridine kinase [Oleiphilus sp. HI0122]KZZ69763.1 uridine kinase [Oleiphilus sp. HI0130]KZZ80611.1 uridine kinase [Oleiphilus sp. HI0133]
MGSLVVTDRPLLVGVAGASASGKSLLSTNLGQSMSPDLIQVISEDNYYQDQTHLAMAEREKTNYDHPRAIEHDLLHAHIESLKSGQSVLMPRYDFAQHTRSGASIEIHPTPIIVVEGIMLFTHKALRDALDLKFFVDTPLDICLLRRLQRDTLERGRSVESVLNQYKHTVRPGYINFIAPTKEHADMIIPRGGRNAVAIDLIHSRFRAHIG